MEYIWETDLSRPCPCGDVECRDISVKVMPVASANLEYRCGFLIKCHGKESYGSIGFPLYPNMSNWERMSDIRAQLEEIVDRTLVGLDIPKADWFKEP